MKGERGQGRAGQGRAGANSVTRTLCVPNQPPGHLGSPSAYRVDLRA